MNCYVRSFLVLIVLFIVPPMTLGTDDSDSWSKDEWDQAFARRNYQLGMTLEDFRAERFPDQEYSPDAFPVCSNDSNAESNLSYYRVWALNKDLKEAGVITCHYYFSESNSNVKESARLLAVDWGTTTDFHFLKPEGSDNYFLYQIVSILQQPIFNELFQAYKAGMKSEPTIEKRVVQNRMGATFENVIASWENEVSILQLEKYYSDLDTLAIVLTLKPLAKIVEERMDEVHEDRAKRL